MTRSEKFQIFSAVVVLIVTVVVCYQLDHLTARVDNLCQSQCKHDGDTECRNMCKTKGYCPFDF